MEEYILEECPICRGAGLLMHEGGWNVQVECADCSAHTVYVEYEDEDEKAMVGKLALVNEAKKYLAEEKGREATVHELAAYTQLTEEELSDILLLIQKADQKDK